MTRVFDYDGTEKTLAWLAQEYDGCTVLPARVQPGDKELWRLAAIYVQGEVSIKAPAVLKIELRNQEGRPVVNQPVVMTFPSLEDPNGDLEDLTGYANRWADRGVVHRTNSDGLFGFGLGPAYGPFYHTWPLSGAPSDCLTGAGMKGETAHFGPLHGVWILGPATETPPPPPPPPPPPAGDDVLAAIAVLHGDLKLLGRHLGAW